MSTKNKILFIMVCIIVFLILLIIIRQQTDHIINPDSVIIETLNIDNDKMEITILNSSSACVIKKCEIEEMNDNLYIMVYETAYRTKNTFDSYYLHIQLKQNIKNVYISGKNGARKKLIWKKA